MKTFPPSIPTAARLGFTVLAAAFFLAACGYHFAGGGPLPGGVRSVYVPLLTNATGETGLDGVVTDALLYEITRRGNRVAAASEGADAVLTGVVRGAVSETISRSTIGTAQERRVRLTVGLDLRRTGEREATIWSRGGVEATETYAVVDGDRRATDENRRRALEEAARKLAEQALTNMSADF